MCNDAQDFKQKHHRNAYGSDEQDEIATADQG